MHGKTLPIDLIQLEVQECDVNLGIDWLSRYKVTINGEKKLTALLTSEGVMLEYRRS